MFIGGGDDYRAEYHILWKQMWKTIKIIIGAMQKAISELHRLMKIVREYLENKTMNAAVATMSIDYSDPEQEFYLRIFTEVEQKRRAL